MSSHFRLERRHFGAEDEVLRITDTIDGCADLIADRRVLRLQVQERDFHSGHTFVSAFL